VPLVLPPPGRGGWRGRNWRRGHGWQPLDVPAGIRVAGSAKWWLVLLDDDVGQTSPWGVRLEAA
jgi:hypothetical protein